MMKRDPEQLALFDRAVEVSVAMTILKRSRNSIIRMIEDGRLLAYQHGERGRWYIWYKSIEDHVKRIRAKYFGEEDTNGARSKGSK
jgi:hypothetical protein